VAAPLDPVSESAYQELCARERELLKAEKAPDATGLPTAHQVGPSTRDLAAADLLEAEARDMALVGDLAVCLRPATTSCPRLHTSHRSEKRPRS
jgi:hypothetical protein